MTELDPFQPITLRHASVPTSVSILPYGLTIQSIQTRTGENGQAEEHDIISSFENPRNHGAPNRNFYGPIIGRYANRLPVGMLQYDGNKACTTEEFSAPGVSLHGGPHSSQDIPKLALGEVRCQDGPFDRIVWAPIPANQSQLFSAASTTAENLAGTIVAKQVFAIESPHGAQGFPGKLRVEACVALSTGSKGETSLGAVHLNYRAKLLSPASECEATPLNLTQHWGFNLSASSRRPAALEEQGQIDRHFMQIIPPANQSQDVIRLLTLDQKALPTGVLDPIDKSSEHDFTKNNGKVFGECLPNGGYDHYYFWGPAASRNQPLLHEERLILSAPSTNLSVSFRSNQTGVQCYTTNGQPAAPAESSQTGGARKLIHRPTGKHEAGGRGYGNHERSSVMLEFGSPHATFIHKDLQVANGDSGDTILRSGAIYDHVVVAELKDDNST